MADLPLPALLSQVLVAYTIELDNEFEHRMPHRTTRGPAATSRRGPWLVSLPMWANFLRFVDRAGVPLAEVKQRADLVNLAGLQRWGYLRVEPDRRVCLDCGGGAANKVWAPLPALIEARWQERFGPRFNAVRDALNTVDSKVSRPLPPYLPVSGVAKRAPVQAPAGVGGTEFSALLSRTLYAFALDFESASRLSLSLCANALRVLDEDGVRMRDLPARAGISREAVDVSVKFLERHDCAVVGNARVARLTERGRAAQRSYRRTVDKVADGWRQRYGAGPIEELQTALAALLSDQDALVQSLTPYP